MRTNMSLVWFLLLIDVIASSVGSVFAKRMTTTWTLASLLAYTLANLTWIGTLRAGGGQLARMGMLCDLCNCFAVVVLGLCVYGETLSIRRGVGLAVALVGMVLLGAGD